MKMSEGKYEIEVKWFPFQLNPAADKKPVSKVDAYMKKFGMSKPQVMSMAQQMTAKFATVGLPFEFGDDHLVGNTFDGHRLVAYAGAKHGLKVQDKVMEKLFYSYFTGKWPDKKILLDAATSAGIPADEAKKVVEDEAVFAKETNEEMKYGSKMRTYGLSGVPFFVLSVEGGKEKEYLSGAVPPKDILAGIQALLEAN